jgi:hypothetical protein
MVAATDDEKEVFQEQINWFEEQNPDINIELSIVEFDEFNDTLSELIGEGIPPDVAALSYDQIAELQGFLEPLDELVANLKDFLSDALESNRFNGQLYGLPWRRSACVPYYHNLVLFKKSKHPTEAFKLMDFLTQEGQQQQNYADLKWFPTLRSFYGPEGIDCPDIQVIRPTAENVSQMIELVNARAPDLDLVLKGQPINAYEATVVTDEEGQIRVAAAPVTAEDEKKVYLPLVLSSGGIQVTAPATAPASKKEEFKDPLFADGLIVGALFITDTIDIQDSSGITITLEDDYAVKCQIGSLGPCTLLEPAGEEIEVNPGIAEVTDAPVGQPFCTVETGSIRICFHIDSRRFCIRIR